MDKVRSLHWVSIEHAIKAEVRLYDDDTEEEQNPDAEDWKENLNQIP